MGHFINVLILIAVIMTVAISADKQVTSFLIFKPIFGWFEVKEISKFSIFLFIVAHHIKRSQMLYRLWQRVRIDFVAFQCNCELIQI